MIVGVLGLFTALYFQNVYQLMVKSFSILMVGLFVPMTAAIYWRKANEAGAVASMVGGLVSWIAFEYWNHAFAENALPSELLAAAIGLIVLLIVSAATWKLNAPQSLTDIDGRAVEMRDRFGILSLRGVRRRRES